MERKDLGELLPPHRGWSAHRPKSVNKIRWDLLDWLTRYKLPSPPRHLRDGEAESLQLVSLECCVPQQSQLVLRDSRILKCSWSSVRTGRRKRLGLKSHGFCYQQRVTSAVTISSHWPARSTHLQQHLFLRHLHFWTQSWGRSSFSKSSVEMFSQTWPDVYFRDNSSSNQVDNQINHHTA